MRAAIDRPLDFLDELAELALGSRIKRLGDRMMAEAERTYRVFGHDAQPKWFGLLALLYRRGPLSVGDAAEQLGLTQPAVSQFLRGLEQKGWVRVKLDPADGRRRIAHLTRRGRGEVEAMQPMWRAGDAAAKRLCDEAGGQLLESLQRFEQALSRRSLAERAMEEADGHAAKA